MTITGSQIRTIGGLKIPTVIYVWHVVDRGKVVFISENRHGAVCFAGAMNQQFDMAHWRPDHITKGARFQIQGARYVHQNKLCGACESIMKAKESVRQARLVLSESKRIKNERSRKCSSSQERRTKKSGSVKTSS